MLQLVQKQYHRMMTLPVSVLVLPEIVEQMHGFNGFSRRTDEYLNKILSFRRSLTGDFHNEPLRQENKVTARPIACGRRHHGMQLHIITIYKGTKE